MGSTLWFIEILQEQPWLGFILGLVFLTVMFGSKNLIVYLYAKNQEKKRKFAGSGAGLLENGDSRLDREHR